MIPTGNREIAHRGSPLFPLDAPEPKPMLVHVGEPYTGEVTPDLDEPIDETWLKLEPVHVNGELVPIIYSTTTLHHTEHDPWMLPRLAIDGYVHTVGPFKGQRFLEAIRVHQLRRLSLTFDVRTGDHRHGRARFFDVRLALDFEVQMADEARWWLDWQDVPIHREPRSTAVMVHRDLSKQPA